MISSFQPSRPKVTAPPAQNPMHQQQIRPSSTEQQQYSQRQPNLTPRSQIEAMPPHQRPINPPAVQPFNPATLHPVFFSEAWRRAPFPLPGTPGGYSPVATGYAFGAGVGAGATRKEGLTKL